MAGFLSADGTALANRDETCYLASRTNNGVINKSLSAATGATDKTTLAAASTGNQHVIVGGWLSSSGAEIVNIFSGTEKIDSLTFSSTKTRAPFPVGLHADSGELLAIQKVSTATMTGYIEYITIPEGASVPSDL